MAKIQRVVQYIFGNQSNDIVQFGSEASNNITRTLDVKLIQTLNAWANGWRSALIGSQKATLQDQNSVNYVVTSQLANIFQDGIPIYNADTTYYTACICREDTTTQLYKSLTDSNVGNALTDTAHWQLLCDLSGLASISGGASLFATNGYYTLPTGLIMQWGQVPAAGDTYSQIINFPIAFPSNCFNVTLSTIGAGLFTAGVSVPTLTNFVIDTDSWNDSNPDTFHGGYFWQAIGN